MELDEKARASAALIQRAVLLAGAAEGALSLMDTLIKLLSARYPVLQLSFLRFAMGTVFAVALFFARSPQWPTADAVHYNATRSIVAVGAAVFFFIGLSKLPIAEAMALSFAAPLWIAVLGVVLLGERISLRIGLALLAGVIGMLVIVGGQLGGRAYTANALLGAAAVLLSTVFYAFAIIMLRVRANTDPLPTIVLFQNAGPALLLAIPGLLSWQLPTLDDVGLFAMVGFLGVSGHTLLALAFAKAEAARLAPIHYLVLVWGTLYGWLFFGALPGAATIVGATIVVVATLLARRH